MQMPQIDILVSQGGRGGVENVVNRTALYLKDKGMKVRILQFADADYRWADESLEYKAFWPAGQRIEFDETIDMIIEYYRKNGTPDLLFAVTWPALNAVAAIIRGELGAKFRIGSWMHAALAKYESFGWGGARELMSADFHLAINHGIATEIRTILPLARVYEIINPPETERIFYSEQRDPKRFCVVNRLDTLKHTEQVVRAAAAMDGVKLDILGSGEEEENLRALIKELNAGDRVTLHGWKDNPWEIVKEAGTLVLASEEEAEPLSVVEALLSGKAVIASGVGSIPDWAEEGKKIRTCAPRDFEKMRQLMEDTASQTVPLPTAEECRASAAEFEGDKPLAAVLEIVERELRPIP